MLLSVFGVFEEEKGLYSLITHLYTSLVAKTITKLTQTYPTIHFLFTYYFTGLPISAEIYLN